MMRYGPAEGDRGLGAVARQRVEPLARAARQQHRHHVAQQEDVHGGRCRSVSPAAHARPTAACRPGARAPRPCRSRRPRRSCGPPGCRPGRSRDGSRVQVGAQVRFVHAARGHEAQERQRLAQRLEVARARRTTEAGKILMTSTPGAVAGHGLGGRDAAHGREQAARLGLGQHVGVEVRRDREARAGARRGARTCGGRRSTEPTPTDGARLARPGARTALERARDGERDLEQAQMPPRQAGARRPPPPAPRSRCGSPRTPAAASISSASRARALTRASAAPRAPASRPRPRCAGAGRSCRTRPASTSERSRPSTMTTPAPSSAWWAAKSVLPNFSIDR